ncbi:secreted and transmembrane protein 1 [Thomomys bottae]
MPTRGHHTVPEPVPRVLGALLLLATALSAQNERWDEPACTQGEVSVSRGQRAVMTCNISNPFTHITLRLSGPRENRTVFSVDLPPGGSWVSSQDGWQLLVQGGRAQLVVEPAQDSHAGLYSWRLHGHQLNHRSVFLSVLEPPDQQPAAGPGLAMASRDGGAVTAFLAQGLDWRCGTGAHGRQRCPSLLRARRSPASRCSPGLGQDPGLA